MPNKRISVTKESSTGRNERFHDNRTGADFTRAGLVRAIKHGDYPNHHIRKINGVENSSLESR